MAIRSDSLVTTLMLYSINTGELHLFVDWLIIRMSLSLQVSSHRKETSYFNTRLNHVTQALCNGLFNYGEVLY